MDTWTVVWHNFKLISNLPKQEAMITRNTILCFFAVEMTTVVYSTVLHVDERLHC